MTLNQAAVSPLELDMRPKSYPALDVNPTVGFKPTIPFRMAGLMTVSCYRDTHVFRRI